MRTPAMNMANSSRLYKAYMVLGFACVLLLLLVTDIYHASEPVDKAGLQEPAFSMGNTTSGARKLLALGDDDGSVNRIDASCSKDNILIFQGANTPLPNGIPTYSVQVQNVCVQGSCSIFDIHLRCGWFSSARLINPRIFRRIGYDDCLVKDGEPLGPGECLSFQYANTFEYPMSVSSIACY